jgi:hypothetical protein
MPALRDMNLGAEELNWVGSCRIMAKKELGRESKALCVLQLQWDWYSYCIEIRCQDRLINIEYPCAYVTVNCKVWI